MSQESNMTPVLCNCDGMNCFKSVHVPTDEIDQLIPMGLLVIVDGCPNGPPEEAVLEEEREGYKIYSVPYQII